MQEFSYKKMNLKMLSAYQQPFGLTLDILGIVVGFQPNFEMMCLSKLNNLS